MNTNWNEKIENAVVRICPDLQKRKSFASAIIKQLSVITILAFRDKENSRRLPSLQKQAAALTKDFEDFWNSLQKTGILCYKVNANLARFTKSNFKIELDISEVSQTIKFLQKDLGRFENKKLKRGPQNQVSEAIAIMIAEEYFKYLGKLPKHSKADSSKKQNPYGQVCNIINELLQSFNKQKLYGRINDAARKNAITLVALHKK